MLQIICQVVEKCRNFFSVGENGNRLFAQMHVVLDMVHRAVRFYRAIYRHLYRAVYPGIPCGCSEHSSVSVQYYV
ncbi:hypothetical protein KP79_PYT15769 [Mizuhopecten yessoensis]|uniref:Uncharacterized protein n=1 Tax=Mizuhopecten yessoensis TaxID=6573 RepID=A0A210Q1S3_MIZYE|nr:hypothetical protein KP79_PYT15769 [Mizuhopecten yessoensis]